MHPQKGTTRGIAFAPVALIYIIVAACAGFGAGLAVSAKSDVAAIFAAEPANAPRVEAEPAGEDPGDAGSVGPSTSLSTHHPLPDRVLQAEAPAERAPGRVARASLVHRVKRGDTLSALARAYNTTTADLARLNGLKDVDRLMQGFELRIPGADRSGYGILQELAVPVFGPVSSGFGYRWGRPHEGIDIASKHGHPVRASADGRVVFSGWKGGYGNVVVLEHADDVQTWYGHLSKALVKQGQKVLKASTIGLVGSTGHSTGPHLHFEVRIHGRPIDPSFVLGVNWAST